MWNRHGGYVGRRTGITSLTFTPSARTGLSPKAERKARISGARAMAARTSWAAVPNGGHRFSTSRTELKGFDLNNPTGSAALSLWGSCAFSEPAAAYLGITELNDVQQGAAFYNRVGSKISSTSLLVRFSVFQATTPISATIRYAIVYDRQCNGAAPAITDIFGVNGNGAGNNAGVNLTNRGRFLVLRDKCVTIDPASCLCEDVEEYCKLPQLETEFKATGGTIGDISTGAFYLIVGLVAGVGAGTVALNSLYSRLRYLD